MHSFGQTLRNHDMCLHLKQGFKSAQFIWEDIPEALVSGEMSQRNTPSGRSPVWTTGVPTCWEFSSQCRTPIPESASCGAGYVYITTVPHWLSIWALLLGGVNSPRQLSVGHQVKHQGKEMQMLECGSQAGFSKIVRSVSLTASLTALTGTLPKHCDECYKYTKLKITSSIILCWTRDLLILIEDCIK